jgi:hypothetical protein
MSNLADGIFIVALPLVALGITRDPRAFAALPTVSTAGARCSWSTSPAPG